jgi:hypothetical protein
MKKQKLQDFYDCTSTAICAFDETGETKPPKKIEKEFKDAIKALHELEKACQYAAHGKLNYQPITD